MKHAEDAPIHPCCAPGESPTFALTELAAAGGRRVTRRRQFQCDGTLAHAVERILGAVSASRGEIYWR